MISQNNVVATPVAKSASVAAPNSRFGFARRINRQTNNGNTGRFARMDRSNSNSSQSSSGTSSPTRGRKQLHNKATVSICRSGPAQLAEGEMMVDPMNLPFGALDSHYRYYTTQKGKKCLWMGEINGTLKRYKVYGAPRCITQDLISGDFNGQTTIQVFDRRDQKPVQLLDKAIVHESNPDKVIAVVWKDMNGNSYVWRAAEKAEIDASEMKAMKDAGIVTYQAKHNSNDRAFVPARSVGQKSRRNVPRRQSPSRRFAF